MTTKEQILFLYNEIKKINKSVCDLSVSGVDGKETFSLIHEIYGMYTSDKERVYDALCEIRKSLESDMSEKQQKKTAAYKNDILDGKLRWDLLPFELIEPIVKVFTFGAKKYSPWTWNKLDNGYERYKAAMIRHMLAFEKGEFFDKESNLPHLAHMLWNAMAMYYFGCKDNENGLSEDDRREHLRNSN